MSTGPATNAQVTAGKDLTVVSGRDASFTGANVGGDNVYMDVGRNLVVASRQNESSNSSKGFNFDVTFTPNGGVSSFNLGGSYGYGARKYTDTPTTIIANKVLDIYTGQTTFLLGAVLNSKTGALKFDTGNFVFDNFNDTEQQKNIAVSIGVDVKDPSKTSLGGSLYYKNKAGITYATVGAGEIKIRNNPTQNLITLNRDAANVQRVVKDQTIDIKIPAVNLKTLVDDVDKSVNFFRALATDVPDEVRAKGRMASDLFVNAVLSGLSDTQVRAFLASAAFEKALRAREAVETAIHSGKSSRQEILAAATEILKGEALFFKDGNWYLKTSCDQGKTPCDVLIDKLQLQKRARELTKDEIFDIIAAKTSILLSGDKVKSAEGAEFYKLAWQCAVSWSIETNDPSLLRQLKASYGDAYNGHLVLAGLNPINVDIAERTISAMKSGNINELANVRAGIERLLNANKDALVIQALNGSDPLLPQLGKLWVALKEIESSSRNLTPEQVSQLIRSRGGDALALLHDGALVQGTPGGGGIGFALRLANLGNAPVIIPTMVAQGVAHAWSMWNIALTGEVGVGTDGQRYYKDPKTGQWHSETEIGLAVSSLAMTGGFGVTSVTREAAGGLGANAWTRSGIGNRLTGQQIAPELGDQLALLARQQHGLGLELRNIGIADLRISGQSPELLHTISGAEARAGTVGMTDRQFFAVENAGAQSKAVHTEAKLLEYIAQNYGQVLRERGGTINMFSERIPCSSCTGVVQQFQAMFPNVQLNVTYGRRF